MDTLLGSTSKKALPLFFVFISLSLYADRTSTAGLFFKRENRTMGDNARLAGRQRIDLDIFHGEVRIATPDRNANGEGSLLVSSRSLKIGIHPNRSGERS